MKREKEEMLKNKNKIGHFRAFYFICVFWLFSFLNNCIKEKKMKMIVGDFQNRGDFLEERIRKLMYNVEEEPSL